MLCSNKKQHMLLCLCPGFAHESLVRRSEAKEIILCALCEFFLQKPRLANEK